jgi:cell division protein FtsA
LVETQAEQLKITYGSAVMEKNAPVDEKEGIALYKINTVVEARVKEIVENVYTQVKSTGKLDTLEKIVLAGAASSLKNLPELVRERFKTDVCFSTIRKEWMDDDDERIGDPRYMTTISMLIKGTDNCIYIPPVTTTLEDDGQKGKGGKKKQSKGDETEGSNFFKKLFAEILKQD